MSDVSSQPARKKTTLIVIPILAIAFGYVVYTNVLNPGTKKPAANADSNRSRNSNASSGNNPGTSATANQQPTTTWPKFTLDEIVGHSPFDPLYSEKPATNSTAKLHAEKLTTKSLSTSPTTMSITQSKTSPSLPNKNGGSAATATLGPGVLQAVFKNENGIAAIVDSKIVRPGDTIRGAKIIAITPTTIFLENHRTIEAEKAKTETHPAKN